MARTDALTRKERAARVEQQRRSFAGIEKQQAERVAALEEQLAAEKLRLQKTRLNIQQTQQETDRIALLVAAQTAADELKGDSDDLLPDEFMDEEQEAPIRYRTYSGKISRAPSRDDDADPSGAGRQCPSALSPGGSAARLPHRTCRILAHQTSNAEWEEPAMPQTTLSGAPSLALSLLRWRNCVTRQNHCALLRSRIAGFERLLLSFTMTLQPLHDFLSLDLHPFSRCAIGLLGDLQVHQLKRILIFTDGSHDQHNSETDTNNGWSMVVIAQHF